MKKIRFMTILTLISFLLSSCTSVKHVNSPKNKENTPLKIPLEIDSNAEISFFTNGKLYYFNDEFNKEKPELANKILSEYSIMDKKSKILSSFPDISDYSGSITLNKNKLYLPLYQNNTNVLFEINLQNNHTRIMKKWNAFPPFAFIYNLKNNLILFGPNSLNNTTLEYYINTINLVDNKEVNIVKKEIKNHVGELISCLDVDGNNIYAFSITATKNDQKYSIIKYDITGKQINIYPFDLQMFLNPAKTLADQDDAIFSIYKEKNYFIFNTLNGRVFIFKLINDKLEPVTVPDKFYKKNPSGFRFIEYFDGKSDFAYFYNTFNNNNVVTVFNYLTEEFTSLKFPKDNSVYNYFRNAHGDLVVKKSSKDQNLSRFYYYTIDHPDKTIVLE